MSNTEVPPSGVFNGDCAVALRWPAAAQSPVEIGGVTVSCSAVVHACEILHASGASAIRAVLLAAGSPLAGCDYHAVYQPGLPAARAALQRREGCIGPRGRHLAKFAFERAVRELVAEAAGQLLEQCIESFRADERYASAIAADAVVLLSRQGQRRAAAA